MTFRATVRDGTIVSGDAQYLPEGTELRVSVVNKRPSRTPVRTRVKKKSSSRKKTMTVDARLAILEKSFGISKDRPDWKGRTTQEIARELRERASGKWAKRRKLSRG
jgi:hypothetical protein